METMTFEIDGRPATAYSLDEARRALRADGTHPLSVSDAAGKKVKINLELPSLQSVFHSAQLAQRGAQPQPYGRPALFFS